MGFSIHDIGGLSDNPLRKDVLAHSQGVLNNAKNSSTMLCSLFSATTPITGTFRDEPGCHHRSIRAKRLDMRWVVLRFPIRQVFASISSRQAHALSVTWNN